MSYTGAENQLRLYAGYAKIAAQLGHSYALYPHDMLNPLDSGKSVGNVNMSLSADPGFSAPLKYNKAVWISYMDGDLVSPFQFLVGPYGKFYIADKQPFQPMQVVRTNRQVSIGRGQYSTSGPLLESIVDYATDLPVFMQFTREDIQKPASSTGAQLGRAITHWTAFIPMLQGYLHQDDIVTDEQQIRYVVDAPDFTNMGYVAHLRLASI